MGSGTHQFHQEDIRIFLLSMKTEDWALEIDFWNPPIRIPNGASELYAVAKGYYCLRFSDCPLPIPIPSKYSPLGAQLAKLARAQKYDLYHDALFCILSILIKCSLLSL